MNKKDDYEYRKKIGRYRGYILKRLELKYPDVLLDMSVYHYLVARHGNFGLIFWSIKQWY